MRPELRKGAEQRGKEGFREVENSNHRHKKIIRTYFAWEN